MATKKNFEAVYKYIIRKEDAIIRGLELSNGVETKIVELTNKESVDLRLFKEKIASRGEFFFYGNNEDFQKFIKLVFATKPTKIKMIEKLGKSSPVNFVTNNFMYVGASVIGLSEDGFKFAGSYYKLDNKLNSIPILTTNDVSNYENILQKFISASYKSLNDSYEGLISLTFLRASLHATEIIRYFDFFPFLLVVGEKSSGKNFFCKTLLKVMGIDTNGDGIPSSTSVGILRKSTMMVDLPYWLDEYSDNKESGKKIEGFLRSAFNRSPFIKADLDSAKDVVTTICTSTFILSGESMSSDIATRERFINITLSKAKQNFEGKNELVNLEKDLHVIGSKWIMGTTITKQQELREGISKEMKALLLIFPSKDSRIVTIYAILLYFLKLILIDAKSDLNAEQLIWTFLDEDSESKEGASHVIKFWEDFITLVKTDQIINGQHFYYGTNKKLYVHWSTVKSAMLQLRKKQGLEMRIEEDTLKNYLNQAYGYRIVVTSPMIEGIRKPTFRSLMFELYTLPDFVIDQFEQTQSDNY
ncbi:MAG: hypothetical protein SH817_09955 [Leptospira sp.]|nr:hypothetical protein [Leptospira sp.]